MSAPDPYEPMFSALCREVGYGNDGEFSYDSGRAATERLLALPDTRQLLTTQGLEPLGNTPEEFAAQVKAELAKWARVAANAAITPE